MRTMQIEVLLFGPARDAVGASRALLEVPEGAAVARAVELLLVRHPALVPARSSLRYAVNESFVDAAAPLRAGDRLAVLPPVSGG
jgi:sulfur-carrier protein